MDCSLGVLSRVQEWPENECAPQDSTSTPPELGAEGGRGGRRRRQRLVSDAPSAASPAASGPAGARLEGHVGAQYLLPLLTGGEARGLPGVVVTRVSFQRAAAGHPMDDVVASGTDAQGRVATLEVQAKRTITFTAGNCVFGDVVALACQAASASNFYEGRHELAVAVARSSTKIEQHVQVVLRWAREYQSSATFFARLSQPAAAHQAMRDFVSAFRNKMQAAGAEYDDEAVWRLLSRFQVLVFDLESPGSFCMSWARERCATALASAQAARSAELWDSLAQIALETDSAGGELDAPALIARLGERGYQLAGDRRFHEARERLAESSRHALADTSNTVHGLHVDRNDALESALLALEKGRYLEIGGAGGVGKSGVLKDLAGRLLDESRILVLAPNRVPSGGWAALRLQLGCDATAKQLLSDLAGDGGGYLLIDGIDRFDEPGQKHTVADLLREVAEIPGFRVVATTRGDVDTGDREWMPEEALQTLGRAPTLQIGELTDEQVAQLRGADPTLAALLRPGHPAERLVRNLYRLDRLSRATGSDCAVLSEAQMAKQWWDSGDDAPAAARIERRRVLHALAVHLLSSSAPLDSAGLHGGAITGLVESGTLRSLSAVRMLPMHDVLGDWAVGCLLFEEPERVASLHLSGAAPVRLARAIEIAARLHAELDADTSGWQQLLTQVSRAGAHGSWRRNVLLALVRSERSADMLDKCLPRIEDDEDAKLLAEIIRTSVVVDSQPAAQVWGPAGIDVSKFPDDFALPRGPAWANLVTWSLGNVHRFTAAVVPELVDLYSRWCNAHLGRDVVSPLLVRQLYNWLVAVETSTDFHGRDWGWQAGGAQGLSLPRAARQDLRRAFLAWCLLCPEQTAAYLSLIAVDSHRDEAFEGLLTFVGTAPNAAPQALADVFLRALKEGDEDADEHGFRELFPYWDHEYLPASPARPPFLTLLQVDKEQGLRLIRGLIDYAVSIRSGGRASGEDEITIRFPNGPRSFPWERSYMMSRTDDSYIVQSALMALEAWGHQRLDAGEPVQEVLRDVLGPEGSPVAYLLIGVDLLLSHWPSSREHTIPFASSPELLALERVRLAHEQLGEFRPRVWVHPEPEGDVRLANLQQRQSRRLALESVLPHFAINGPEDLRLELKNALQQAVVRLGPPDQDSGLNDPRLMAIFAINLLEPSNYRGHGDPPGSAGYEYVAPADEAARFSRLQQESASRITQMALVGQLTQAITDAVCPMPLVEQGVAWATRPASAEEEPEDDTEREMFDRAKIIAASLLLRDGSPELRAAHGAWAAALLASAADSDVDENRPRQFRYNILAIAASGLLAGHRRDPITSDLPRLLQLAARPSTEIADVIRHELNAGRAIAEDVQNSLMRLALSASIYTFRQRNDDLDAIPDYQAQEAARMRADHERRQVAVDAELAWLGGRSPEPTWPDFPPPHEPRPRRRIRTGAITIEPDNPAHRRVLALDDSRAAKVLEVAVDLWRASNPERLGSLVRHAWPWTALANGVGAPEDSEPGELAFAWNHAYFPAALAAAVALGPENIPAYVTEGLAELPEERLLMAAGATLRELDQLWLGRQAIADDVAAALREAIAQKIRATWHWRQLTTGPSTGVASDAAEAVAAMFMCHYTLGKIGSYVLPPGLPRADRCLADLEQAAVEASGSTFVALAILSFLEVQPHPSRLAALARLVAAWWAAHGASTAFWTDHGVAERVCNWIDKGVLDAEPDPAVLESSELASIHDILLNCGGPTARALEQRVTRAGR